MAALVERSSQLARAGRPTNDSRLVRPERFGALVVHANSSVREGLVRRLRGIGARDVAEAASIGQARLLAHSGPPRALVVSALGLPDGSGLALLDELRAVGWAHGVLLAEEHDAAAVRAALAAGARGMLVGKAGTATTPPVPAIAMRSRARDGIESLSAREREVLQHVANGRSNRQIGEELGLSALTVKSHLARIARKLGTGDRAELVARAMRAGAIS